MKRKGGRKLRTRMMVSYLVVCILPLLLTVFLISVKSARSLQEDARARASLYSAQIVGSIDSFTDSYSSLTRLLIIDYDILAVLNEDTDSIYEQLNRSTAARKLLMRVAMVRPDVQNVMLLTNSQQLYQYSGRGISVDKNALIDRDWLQRIRTSSNDLTITATHPTDYYETDSGGITVSVARRLYGADGAEKGILIVDIDPYSLVKRPDAAKLEGMDDQVRVIVRTAEGGLVYDSLVSDGRATWAELLAGDHAPEFREEDYVGRERTSDDLLEVTVVIPWRSMMRGIFEFSRAVTLVMIGSIIVILLLSSRVAGRITRPITELQEKMDEAKRGSYNLMPIPDRPDEMGVLIEHYDHMIETIHKLIDEVYLGEIKQKDAMLIALRAQINPHVLFNTLEAIRMKAVVNGDMESAGMIKMLSKMFRATLDADPATSTIRSELEYATNYIEIQNIRFRDRFDLICRIPEALLDVSVPPIVFQPILENSIEHGGRASHERLALTLSASVQGGDLIFSFSDNGAGMSRAQMDALNRDLEKIARGEIETFTGHERIALRNIAERLYLRYGEGYGLRVEASSGEGTRVSMRIPYHQIADGGIGRRETV